MGPQTQFSSAVYWCLPVHRLRRDRQSLRILSNLPRPRDAATWSPLGRWPWWYKRLIGPPQQVVTKVSSSFLCSLPSGCPVMICTGQYRGQNRGRQGPVTEGVSGELCHAVYFSLPALCAFLFLVEKPDGPDFSGELLSDMRPMFFTFFHYIPWILKHQPYTLTNSTWTFSSCFFLKQSQNTLVKKIYDNFSIFFHFICLLNSTF